MSSLFPVWKENRVCSDDKDRDGGIINTVRPPTSLFYIERDPRSRTEIGVYQAMPPPPLPIVHPHDQKSVIFRKGG